MKVTKNKIKGILELEPKVFEDSRGYFFESYNEKQYAELGISEHFVQDNQSMSQKGVLRGLHLQNPPYAQGKLVKVIKGAVLDVVVDLRKNSPSYGEHHKVILSEKNKKALWIPKGFAHGFLTLENDTIFNYKVSEYYNKESEVCIKWNDKSLNIDWDIDAIEPLVSQKDELGISYKDFISKFI